MQDGIEAKQSTAAKNSTAALPLKKVAFNRAELLKKSFKALQGQPKVLLTSVEGERIYARVLTLTRAEPDGRLQFLVSRDEMGCPDYLLLTRASVGLDFSALGLHGTLFGMARTRTSRTLKSALADSVGAVSATDIDQHIVIELQVSRVELWDLDAGQCTLVATSFVDGESENEDWDEEQIAYG